MTAPLTFPQRDLLQQQLADALRRGERQRATDVAWRLYASAVGTSFLRRGVPSADVDDLVSQTFLQVLQGLSGFKNVSFEGWLFTLARYQLMGWRTRQRRLGRPLPHRPETHFQDLIVLLDARRLLERLVQELDGIDRWLLSRVCAEQDTDAVVLADLQRVHGLSWTKSQLRTRRWRLRTRLRQHLEQADS